MFFSIFIIVQSSLLSNFRTFSSTIISHFQFSLPLPPPPSQTSWQPLIYFLFLWICLFWTLQMNAAAAAAKSFQSCLTLWDPIDGSPTGSPVPGILQARTLEWVAISFSNAWKWKWSHSVVSDSSRSHGLQPTRLLHLWDFPGKSTGVGCHCFQMNRIKQYVMWPSVTGFFPVRNLVLGSTQMCWSISQHFIPFYCWILFHWIAIPYSSVDGHLSCFYLGAILNNVAINSHRSFCVDVCFQFS